jgi:hypothetical protein
MSAAWAVAESKATDAIDARIVRDGALIHTSVLSAYFLGLN